MSQNTVPDVVVGVDFGMTCTGVSYSMAPEWPEPKPIQHWEGKLLHELANKVPTLLAYHDHSRQIKAWGFLCDRDDFRSDIKELFKLYLDPQYKDDSPDAPTLEEARNFYRDYLSCVHQCIANFFSDSFPQIQWASKKVEFIFSVPTTWKNPSMIADMVKLIKSAGFGDDGPYHSVDIGLTEAEAAAVYASKQQYQKGDVILICDAGGGTTDVNVLKVASARGEPTRLQQLVWVEGRAIGSALIDMKVKKILTERLSQIAGHLQGRPEDSVDLWEIADKLMRGRFENIKCSFGLGGYDVPEFRLPMLIPGLAPGCNFPGIGIYDSSMIIQREELKAIFDQQVDKMLALVDEQVERMQNIHPREMIGYLILSGGLGSSPYLRQRIKSHFTAGRGSNWQNAQDLKIVLAPEPQLAVTIGLVMSRIQEVSRGAIVLKERCCRSSYGITCRELYNPEKHVGESVIYDARDKQRWAVDQIDWFIKQGQTVSSNGISKHYKLKVNPGEENTPRKLAIVMSNLPSDRLPQSMKQGGLKTLCDVEMILQGVKKKQKNRHWYNSGPVYIRVEFEVKIILGPADLKFQLWSNGVHIDKGHEAIEVVWDPASANSGAPAGETAAVYRDN